MSRRANPLLVDTNVILEAFRTGSWRALSSGYAVETVEACVMETQTGYQRRRAELQIEESELRAKLNQVRAVSDLQRANVLLRRWGANLDRGEQDLWAHAISRNDAWILCGPDIASLRFGVSAGCRGRLVSLERLLDGVGFPTKGRLHNNYTETWLASTLGKMVIAESGLP